MHKRYDWTAALVLGLAPAAGFGQAADGLQAWLEKSAVEVRSLAADDEDFSDLEPLVGAIGEARVVQLGEFSHGSGSNFAAKVRLIKFLHQRMGFDVLLWESGLYSLTQTAAGLRAGDDPVESARRGIFPLWSEMAEVKPLFVYAQSTRGTPTPLEMGGFDMQFSSPESGEQFAAELRKFAAEIPDEAVRERATALAGQVLATFSGFSRLTAARDEHYVEAWRKGLSLQEANKFVGAWEKAGGARLAAKPQDLQRFLRGLDDLVDLLRTRREAFLRIRGGRAVDFMRYALEALRDQGSAIYERNAIDRPSDAPGDPAAREQGNRSWNRRDTRNASTLRWQIEEYYRGRKIVIWAHNGHVMNACYARDWGSIHDTPQPGGMKPTGAFLREWFGESVYSVGLTGYEGSEKHMVGPSILPVAAAPLGSLEERLHRLGKPYLFVDFRAAGIEPGHPLHQPLSMRVRGAPVEAMPDLSKVYDAVFFVDHLEPSTPLPRGAPASR